MPFTVDNVEATVRQFAAQGQEPTAHHVAAALRTQFPRSQGEEAFTNNDVTAVRKCLEQLIGANQVRITGVIDASIGRRPRTYAPVVPE